jgi:hypothetical protein
MKSKVYWSLAAAVVALHGCGGGAIDSALTSVAAPSPAPNPAPSPAPVPAPTPAPVAPGGLYVGYYAEDRGNNPEDPTEGIAVLSLPARDAEFSGSMFFTFVGCQTVNIGRVSGQKSLKSLTGSWSGTLDGSPQGGDYKGTYDEANVLYSGTYNVRAGKQFRDLSPCITYYIAAFGNWEIFAGETTVSPGRASPSIDVTNGKATWFPPVGTQRSLIGIVDIEAATNGVGNAVVWQEPVAHPAPNLEPNNAISRTLPLGTLLPGKSYLVAAISFQNNSRIYYSGKTVTR